MNKIKLTEKQISDYLDNPNHCPNCGGEELDSEQIETDTFGAWREVSCLGCDSFWQELFTLTGIS